ncbi:MAG: flagella basal body P-ring formation protein FlgA [Bermanella sp.]|jgi:flagella basal body P-ring formation protein FlgA
MQCDLCCAVLFIPTREKIGKRQMQKNTSKSLSTALGVGLTYFLFVFATTANASMHQSIQHQAALYVQQNAFIDNSADVNIQAAEVDSRIHIPACKAPFEFESSTASLKQSNVSVKVTCPNTNWYLFTSVQVEQTKPVVVTSETMSPGSLLTEKNLYIADIPTNRLRGSTYSSTENLVGARLKRRVRPGQIINDGMLCFVCKGDKVTIMAVSVGLSLKVSGIAQQDGNLGDTIRVQNASSKRIVSATVSSTREVSIQI